MAVAEIFIAAFVTVLFEKLASSDLMRLARSEGLDSQLNKWTNTLSQIQALLVDAGQKHITNTAVGLWLNDLQHLAYDIDDLLDGLATEALRRKLTEESRASTSTRTVQKLIPTCCTGFTRTMMYGHRMSSKLDEITIRLRDLVERKNFLGLIETVERSNRTSTRPEETSVAETGIMGREADKEALLEKVLDVTSDGNVGIIPIVGMGGIGKTTLARLLYNEQQVKSRFREMMVWVCVSDVFDIFMISMIIYQAITGQRPDFVNLNLLQVALQDKLSKKRFLLVLDDVWNENKENWDRLLRPFRVGQPGSKIVITTRSTAVVSAIGRVEVCPLEILSSEESLVLFAQHALGERNFDGYPEIKGHGERIVKKCKGLPLALKALGGALSGKTNEEDWEELLNSEIWSLPENEGNILPALRISYHHLPPHLKQLFAYCSFFPKDYVFEKEELVLLWMAEGFLYQSNSNNSMEKLGRKWFEELRSRSFFQHSANKESRYVMHDLMNDLATSVAGEFSFRLDDGNNVGEKNKDVEKIRHFSFISQDFGVYKKFKALERAKNLRSFLSVLLRAGLLSNYLANKVLVDLLPQLKLLRVLSLSGYNISEVPQSIGDLKHLRYLNLSNTYITCLPEQVGELYNLQTLLVAGCRWLTSLPSSFKKLVNLRHLDLRDTPELKKMPLGIGGLTNLQTLSKVVIEGNMGFKITELKGLSDLRGRLSIMGLHEVVHGNHAKEANLLQKKGLDELEMDWSEVFDESRKEAIEYEVLEGLRPHDKLRMLEIVFYGGTKFPTWVGDRSFVRLTELKLSGCRSCTHLPTLGHLPSLEKLFVKGMDGVKSVGAEFFGAANGILFPKLEVLEFKDMLGWEIWSTGGGNNNEAARTFPCLGELSITGCVNLAEILVPSIPSLRVLRIEGCSKVVLTSMVAVASSIRTLRIERIAGLTQLDG